VPTKQSPHSEFGDCFAAARLAMTNGLSSYDSGLAKSSQLFGAHRSQQMIRPNRLPPQAEF